MTHQTYPHPFENKIKQYRISCGYSRRDIALVIGTNDKKIIKQWEDGSILPDLLSFFKLIFLFKANCYDLYPDVMKQIHNELWKDRDLPVIDF